MTTPSAHIGSRLHGMMQQILVNYAQRAEPALPPARGVVEVQDALDAVAFLAAAIDEEVQERGVAVEKGEHMASMLLVVRDFIRPLPEGVAADGSHDRFTDDLQEIVTVLRTAREQTGQRG